MLKKISKTMLLINLGILIGLTLFDFFTTRMINLDSLVRYGIDFHLFSLISLFILILFNHRKRQYKLLPAIILIGLLYTLEYNASVDIFFRLINPAYDSYNIYIALHSGRLYLLVMIGLFLVFKLINLAISSRNINSSILLLPLSLVLFVSLSITNLQYNNFLSHNYIYNFVSSMLILTFTLYISQHKEQATHRIKDITYLIVSLLLFLLISNDSYSLQSIFRETLFGELIYIILLAIFLYTVINNETRFRYLIFIPPLLYIIYYVIKYREPETLVTIIRFWFIVTISFIEDLISKKRIPKEV